VEGWWVLTFSELLEKRELTVKPPLLKPCQNVTPLIHSRECSRAPFRLLLGVLERDILALVCLEKRAHIRWLVDADSYRSEVVSSERKGSQGGLTFEEGYEFNEPTVPRLALPWFQNNGIFWVGCHVFRMCVEL
jgi:hypothetical protein